MAEQSAQDRMAALAAKRAESSGVAPGKSGIPPARAKSNARLATAGASVVSFAAMVVAMGPLTAGADNGVVTGDVTDDSTTVGEAAIAATVQTPPPNVVIEVVPNYVAADGSPLPDPDIPTELAFDDPAFAADEPVPATEAAAPAVAARPTTAPPAAAAPAPAPVDPAPASPTTAAPATEPPVTAAPATAPPVTAAPVTAAPTPEVPPATEPPAPPKSGASG